MRPTQLSRMPVAAGALLLGTFGWTSASAADTQPIDFNLSGQLTFGCDAGGYCISGDGRFVAFGSTCPNLVSGVTSSFPRVYLRDMVLGTTILVSRTSTGAIPATDGANVGSISDDGRFVLFFSPSALTPNAPLGVGAVYLFDRSTNGVEVISIGSNGSPASGFVEWSDRAPMMTPDGRYVVFNSTEALTPNAGTSFAYRVYLRDRVAQQTSLISPPAAPTEYGLFYAGGILADGSKVLYRNAGGGAGALKNFGVFVHDVASGAKLTVYTEPSPQAPGFLPTRGLDWSADGKWIAFDMSGAHPAFGDFDIDPDVYLADLSTGSVQLQVASIPHPGQSPQGGAALFPSLSNDGRYLSFWALGPEFVPWSSTLSFTGYPCLRDRATGRNSVITLSTTGSVTSSDFLSPAISGDGRYVAFKHFGNDMFPGANGNHLYRRDRIGTTSLGFGKAGFGGTIPALTGSGSFLPGTSGTLNITGAALGKPGILFLAVDRNIVPSSSGPFSGTVFVAAAPIVTAAFTTDFGGQWTVPFTVPVGVAFVPEVYLQAAIVDPASPVGISVSSALLIGM